MLPEVGRVGNPPLQTPVILVEAAMTQKITTVFPAKAGIQRDCFGHLSSWVRVLDSSLRWNDEVGTEFTPNCVLTRKIWMTTF